MDQQHKPSLGLPVKDIPMFFIIGRPRSGTTLLRTIFDAHPNVAIPLECRLISSLYYKYNRVKKWDRNQLEEFYRDVISLPKIETWTLNKEQLREDIINADQNISFADLVKYVYLNYVSFFDKSDIRLIGDKTPFYSYDVSTLKIILNQYPNVKIIHLVRDYRAHYLSMQKTDFEGNYITLVCFRWKFSFYKVREIMKSRMDQYYYLRYEDFASRPKEEAVKLCKFLGIDFTEEMLQYHKVVQEVLKVYSTEEILKYHSSLLKPINADNLRDWETKLPEEKIEFADSVIGKYAEEAGYRRKYTSRRLIYRILVFPDLVYTHLWFLHKAVYGLFFPNSLRKEMPVMAKIFFGVLRFLRK